MQQSDLFVLVCAFFVFLMQPGFIAFECGMSRVQHALPVALKNLIDWALTTLVFGFVGVGLMFGASRDLFGTSGFGFDLDGIVNNTGISTPILVMFQLGFAGTAVTVISGALVERITFFAYVCISVVTAGLIYPLIGHWVWGGLLGGEQGWLESLGFHDFAGASVVHVTGATVAIVGVLMIGPRVGRFGADGSMQPFKASAPALSVLGVMILWIGWWAFNAGSLLELNSDVGQIVLVTNVGGAAGVVGAALFRAVRENDLDIAETLTGGTLAGLVAVTAGADVLDPWAALVIGVCAGFSFGMAAMALRRRQIDDALLAFPVHGVGGAIGTMAVALYARPGSFGQGRLAQFAVQGLGLVVVLAWAGAMSFIVFSVLRRTVGLRIAPSVEVADDRRAEPPRERFQREWADLL